MRRTGRAYYVLQTRCAYRVSVLRAVSPSGRARPVPVAYLRGRAQAWSANCFGHQASLHAALAARGGLWRFPGRAASHRRTDPDYRGVGSAGRARRFAGRRSPAAGIRSRLAAWRARPGDRSRRTVSSARRRPRPILEFRAPLRVDAGHSLGQSHRDSPRQSPRRAPCQCAHRPQPLRAHAGKNTGRRFPRHGPEYRIGRLRSG